ncbi:hypothetical protein C1Y40_02368 [Mycobacterium talmoniae]|uniref:Uncharacterized protein n=1 Tax=Mycobacterium talmoniae TaxID=1858794 RepID=A0A2S8BLE5_9MYCO|nr:hypothetical protein C1Y40_02368 [Mycobacterium talmoniae]
MAATVIAAEREQTQKSPKSTEIRGFYVCSAGSRERRK